MQNQPVLYVREGSDGKDRVLVDANQLAADGTIALDWFQPSENGKYLAYGTSPSGSEMSTLHIIETKTGTALPDTIERTRAASIAWSTRQLRIFITRGIRRRATWPRDRRCTTGTFSITNLGTDPATDPPIFGEGRDPEDWPSVSLDNDGSLLLITVSQGWTKSELFLMDLKKGTPPTRITTGKNFLYSGSVYNGRLYIVTNEDAPRYRVFVTEAGDYERDDWKEIIPQTGSVLQGAAVWGGKIFAQYEQNASSQLRVFDLEGKNVHEVAAAWDRVRFLDRTVNGIGTRFSTGFSRSRYHRTIYRYDFKSGCHCRFGQGGCASIDPAAYEVQQEWCHSKDGTRVPMFVVSKERIEEGRTQSDAVDGVWRVQYQSDARV